VAFVDPTSAQIPSPDRGKDSYKACNFARLQRRITNETKLPKPGKGSLWKAAISIALQGIDCCELSQRAVGNPSSWIL
jgi:hypothetical protein